MLGLSVGMALDDEVEIAGEELTEGTMLNDGSELGEELVEGTISEGVGVNSKICVALGDEDIS